MKETVLVTGAAGFTGQYLRRALGACESCSVIGTSRKTVPGLEVCDPGEVDQVKEVLDRTKPVRIYHCAGTFSNHWETDILANVEATRNLLEAAVQCASVKRILLIGSAAEYGSGKSGAISERESLNPMSIYGITKAIQTLLMKHYVELRGLDIVLARTFNLYGTGISPELFPGRVQHQIDAVRGGEKEYVEVRSLRSSRDYIHVEDAVEAYIRIMNFGNRGEIYNVGSGYPKPIFELLEEMLDGVEFGMEKVRATDEASASEESASFANIEKLSRLPVLESW